jgi:hypothetical protein
MKAALDVDAVVTGSSLVVLDEGHAQDLVLADLLSGNAEHRRLLAPSWTAERSVFVAGEIAAIDSEPSALAAFRSGSAYLWATGHWDIWIDVAYGLAIRFSLTDIEAVVHRAVTADDPDLLGHYAATVIYLDGALGIDAVDPDVLLPLCGFRRPYRAGYRARRRLAIRRSQAGRVDLDLLLAGNRAAARKRAAFLGRGLYGHDLAAARLADALKGRRMADGCHTAGQAQQVVALALLGEHPLVDLPTALTFATDVGALHLVRLLDSVGHARTNNPLQTLARVW